LQAYASPVYGATYFLKGGKLDGDGYVIEEYAASGEFV
jgi:hypothetical protein